MTPEEILIMELAKRLTDEQISKRIATYQEAKKHLMEVEELLEYADFRFGSPSAEFEDRLKRYKNGRKIV